MRSAIRLIAFANGCRSQGILALLDVAIEALDETGDALAAAYVDLARERFIANAQASAERNFEGLPEHE